MEKLLSSLKKIFESKKFVGFLYGIGTVLVLVIVFQAGIFVGYHKAFFGRQWGDNYSRNFGMMYRGSLGEMSGKFPNSHGVSGKIIKIELPLSLVVEGNDKIEKLIVLDDGTHIRSADKDIKPEDLKIDDSVVVIGSPNDQGQIKAKLIRVILTELPVSEVK